MNMRALSQPLLTPEMEQKLQLESRILKACLTSGWTRWNSPVMGLDSRPRPKKPSSTVQIQTDPILTEERGCSSVPKLSIGIQATKEKAHETCITPSLVEFMTTTTDFMCEELKKTEFSSLPKVPSWHRSTETYGWKFLVEQTIRLYKKNPATEELSFPCPEMWYKFDVEGRTVSWNSKGTELAVGYAARGGHAGWCRHIAVPVTIWSLRPNNIKKGPLYSIPFDSCISVVKYHPVLSNYLAVGLCTGEVALIDLYRSDRKPESVDISRFERQKKTSRPGSNGCNSNDFLNSAHKATRTDRYEFKHTEVFVTVDGGCHNNYLISVQWINCNESQAAFLARFSPRPSQYFLVTASKDGYIGLWSIDRETSKFHLERRYVILPTCIPSKCLAPGTSLYQLQQCNMLGLVSFDCVEPTNFVCSTYGSYVFSGTLMSDSEVSETDFTLPRGNSPPICDPHAVLIFQDQEYASKIRRSPHNVNLYAYVTHFGRLVMRNVKNKLDAVLELYVEDQMKIIDIQWSKRPMLLGVAAKSSIILYDLMVHQCKAVMSIQHGQPLAEISFNMATSDYIAGIDKQGTAVVWKLPPELAKEHDREIVPFLQLSKGPYCDNFELVESSESSEEELSYSEADSEDDSDPSPELEPDCVLAPNDEQETANAGIIWDFIDTLNPGDPPRMALYELFVKGELYSEAALAIIAEFAAPEEPPQNVIFAVNPGSLNDLLEQVDSLANPASPSSSVESSLRNQDPDYISNLIQIRRLKQQISNIHLGSNPMQSHTRTSVSTPELVIPIVSQHQVCSLKRRGLGFINEAGKTEQKASLDIPKIKLPQELEKAGTLNKARTAESQARRTKSSSNVLPTKSESVIVRARSSNTRNRSQTPSQTIPVKQTMETERAEKIAKKF